MNKNDNKKMDSAYEEIRAAAKSLPKPYGQVLEMRFGLCGCASSYEEIAKELNLSVEEVKELEDDALRMMRNPGKYATPDKSDTPND